MIYCLINPEQEVVCRQEHDPERGDVWYVDAGWQVLPESECAGLAEAAAPVPRAVAVSMRQMRLWLLRAGMLGRVQTILEGMSGEDGAEARIWWEYSVEVEPGHPLVVALGTALEMDAEEMRAAFVEAGAL